MRTAAFIDLDGTLITANSASLWMKREWRLKHINIWQVLEGTFFLLAYKFRTVPIEYVTVKALRTVKGKPEQQARTWTREWFHQEVAPRIAPGARLALEEHRSKGHMLVLLTSSSLYASEAVTEHLGLDAFICTRYEVQDGLFTGDVVRPICFGRGKIVLAERFAAEQDVDLEASYFYSDSINDKPMLDRVGHPCAVNPDLRLRRLARQRGWPVLDWR
jgi:HAD superfamily hydrolase (TIGR01490 family)